MQIELTKNRMVDIITNGVIDNSELADMYIAHVKKVYGLTVVACYCDASEFVEFPHKIKQKAKLTFSDLKWVNSLSLQIFVRGHIHESMVLSKLGKTLNQVRSEYPDTYDFLMSLKDGLAEINHY